MTPAQNPADPYDVGDRVRVELADDDAESPFDGAVCRVVHVFVDDPERDLDEKDERERETDRAAYRLERVESGEVLPVVLRHRDVVPAADP
ncbi:hypothetical protein [Natronomonas sp.]|uniref:hypothetical protein n=1 Tax=Natronomonas sp. TaxID=2184060 RepID=UPI003974A75D